MTRWYVLIALICICQASYAQNSWCAGIEITEIARSGNPRIRIGHALSDHWSAEARSSFHISRARPAEEKMADIRSTVCELSFIHWTRECYKGMHLSLGVSTGFRKDTDIRLGLGCCLPVWKNIGLDIGYDFKLFEAIKTKEIQSEELTIELLYTF